MNELITN